MFVVGINVGDAEGEKVGDVVGAVVGLMDGEAVGINVQGMSGVASELVCVTTDALSKYLVPYSHKTSSQAYPSSACVQRSKLTAW